MIKFYTKIFLVFFLGFVISCSKEGGKKYKNYKKYTSRKSIVKSSSSISGIKFSHRIKPSDSNVSGNDLSAKFNAIRDDNKLPQKYDSVNADLQDIMVDGKYIGQYKVGQPYQIEDTFYYPQAYETYEEVGTASWYGDDFHGKKTSNGEIYNSGSFTAAHQTLPLPSIVRITNLENGKNVMLRVNDRGPFAKNRVIDVSERAAESLGFHDKGTTMVRIEFLPKETSELFKTLNIKE